MIQDSIKDSMKIFLNISTISYFLFISLQHWHLWKLSIKTKQHIYDIHSLDQNVFATVSWWLHLSSSSTRSELWTSNHTEIELKLLGNISDNTSNVNFKQKSISSLVPASSMWAFSAFQQGQLELGLIETCFLCLCASAISSQLAEMSTWTQRWPV